MHSDTDRKKERNRKEEQCRNVERERERKCIKISNFGNLKFFKINIYGDSLVCACV